MPRDEIFSKLRALQEAVSKIVFTSTIPGFREIWKLEREVRSLILKVVKGRQEATSEKDLLQMILEGAENSGDMGGDEATDKFFVDNRKNIYHYQAGYETTAVGCRSLMDVDAVGLESGIWQAKVRKEVVQVLHGGQLPEFQVAIHFRKNFRN
ncbi:hypothetical protein ACJRO7_003933 [Eucalyptus globulus]|uniref:Uncharacterized protein n=1 Tax=Eucalyptus globulus TaxID=34317 RepID=A0ABD3IXJ9_EUCGL